MRLAKFFFCIFCVVPMTAQIQRTRAILFSQRDGPQSHGNSRGISSQKWNSKSSKGKQSKGRKNTKSSKSAFYYCTGGKNAEGRGAYGKSKGRRKQVIRVCEHAKTDKIVRNSEEENGMKVNNGDFLLWSNPLYDGKNNFQVGTSEGSCTRVPKQSWQCLSTFSLSGKCISATGEIYAQGSLPDFGGSTVWAVTGGTEDFAGFLGTVSVQYPKRADDPPLTFEYKIAVSPSLL